MEFCKQSVMQVDCKLVMEKQSSVWCSSGIRLHKVPSPAEGPRHCFGFAMLRVYDFNSMNRILMTMVYQGDNDLMVFQFQI
ncbi:hypothetical protein VN97_g42 [Penicillium thymicola]|uniref:Uncharacterized protein n=1 Tax=Penicillium thymicola TaxID=293382 RepID=A0AAI9TV02_PENTH|nr:hypothetical protein VN97_g42 [Penicillium thymicola]